jgi:hypothetical protein
MTRWQPRSPTTVLADAGEPDPLGAAVLDFDVLETMRSVRCPRHFVAAVGGDPGPQMRLWRAAVLHEVRQLGIPVSTVDSGHLVPTERPEGLASIIGDWARSLSGTRIAGDGGA